MSNSREANMNDSLNPFDRVTENPKYPFARIYRGSFWQGIADTYDVIVGNHYRRYSCGRFRYTDFSHNKPTIDESSVPHFKI